MQLRRPWFWAALSLEDSGGVCRRLDSQAKDWRSYADIVKITKAACAGEMKGILGWTDDEVVSSDFTGGAASSVFGVNAGLALNDKVVKLVTWYENDWS